MRDVKKLSLTVIGAMLCIAPPAVATICYFPLWIEKSATTTVSGLSMILVLISIVPLFKLIKDHLKTPSAPLLWGIVLAFAMLFRSIIDQVVVIAFIGTLSSVAGFFVFKARDRMGEKEKE